MSEEKQLTRKQQVFVDEYLKCWNAAEAARRAGYSERSAYSQGWENLRKPEIKAEIDKRLDEAHMSADEALKIIADIGHSDMGVFWKIVDEWMFNPLPEYEILEEVEVIDDTKEPPEKRVSYRVRHAVLDMDKVTDPRYSHMIKKFTNSRKTGLSIETYDKHAAARDVLKIAGKFTEHVDVTSGGEKLKIIVEYGNDGNKTETP